MDEREKMIYEIMNAIEYLRKSRIGALIVIERDVSLNDYIVRSKAIYAEISSELLISIFFPRNPLHDGGVIIQGNRITSVGRINKIKRSIMQVGYITSPILVNENMEIIDGQRKI